MTNYGKQKKRVHIKWGVALMAIAVILVAACGVINLFKQRGNAENAISSGSVKRSSGILLADNIENPTISYDANNQVINQVFGWTYGTKNLNTMTAYLKRNGADYAKLQSYVYVNGLSNGSRGKIDLSINPLPLKNVFYDSPNQSIENNTNPVAMQSGTYDLYFTYYYDHRTNPTTLTSNTITFTIEEPSLPLLETPSKHGYTFAGWYYDEALTNPYDGGKITADTKLYAKMDVIQYSVSYNANNGTVSGKTGYNIESETYTLPIPTRTGYTFKGWYTSEDFSGAAVSSIPKGSTGDKAFYAKWEIQVFKVSFYVDGELYLEMDVEYGTKLVDLYLVDSVTLQAVAFSLDSSMLTTYDTNSKITNDLSLFASKDFVVKAGLTYNIDGVETMDLLDYNSTLSDLRTPTKDGYTFDGWYYDAEYTQAVKSTDKLTSNKTIFAKFTEIPPETFGDKVAAFFSDWWWCFAVGGAAVIAIVVFSILYTQKRKV